MEIYEFTARPGVWNEHPNKDGTANCFGRIVRLYYPWKNDTIYCQRECCKSYDHESLMEAGIYNSKKGDFVRHIVASPTHFDAVPFNRGPDDGLFWCMDCGRVGIRRTVA